MIPQHPPMMYSAAAPVLVLLLSRVTFTYACFRWFSPSSNPATTTPSPSHKLPCTALETTSLSCLNRGECFALPSHNELRETGCRCTSEWMGQRCALVDPGVVLAVHEQNVRMAHIAAAISMLVLVGIAALAIVFVCARFKRKTWSQLGNYECSASRMRALCDCQAVTRTDETQYSTVTYMDRVTDGTQDKVIENFQNRDLGNIGDIQPTTQFLPSSKSDISSTNNNVAPDKNGNLHISGVDPS